MKKLAQNILCMQSMFMGIGISSIINNSHEFVFLSILIGTLFGILLIKMLNYNLTNKITTTIGASIIISIALIINVNMVSIMYLDNIPKFSLGLPIILILIYFLYKNNNTIDKLSWIILFICLFLITFGVVFLIPHININNFYLSNIKYTNILKSSFDYGVLSITPVIFIDQKEELIKSYLISTFLILLIVFTIYGILGVNLISFYRYPEYIVLKKIAISGSIENIENIISFHWIFNIFIIMATCTNALKKVINNKKIIIGILIFILILSTLINSHFINIYFLYNNLTYILLTIFIIMFLTNKKTC